MTGQLGDWGSPDVPGREACVLPVVLDRRADEHPERLFAVLADGTAWTYGELRDDTRRTARALLDQGVCPGDTVLTWLPNSRLALRVWFAINYVGAIYVPVNTAYRGGLLAHVIDNSGARVMVADAALVDRLGEIDHALGTVFIDGEAADVDGARTVPASVLTDPSLEPADTNGASQAWDLMSIMYTSGTTGDSKGVMSPYLHIATLADVAFAGRMSADDRYLLDLPLYHNSGVTGVFGALLQGASIALVGAFETSSYREVVEQMGVTCTTLLGAMASFLLKAAPRDGEHDTSLRWVFLIPYSEIGTRFHERFGVEVYTLYNLSEFSVPMISGANPTVPGTCGQIRTGVEARLVDDDDRLVPHGSVGELILRTTKPWTAMTGYWKMPEAAARAWRNGWLHTGDAFRIDEEGNYIFVDRLTDSIRRRGENISSVEVETEVMAHPDVREAAVVAVPSEHGEDEVLAVVAPVDGASLDPEALLEFLRPRLAYFMLPRFIRIMESLPKTPTNKIRKALLREEGVEEGVWDRERAGVVVRRDRFT